MIGQQHVVAKLDLSAVKMTWTRAEVEAVLTHALAGDDDEAKALVNVWVDQAVRKPIRTILDCLGEDANLSGGTMGAPQDVPKLAFILQDVLTNVLVEGFGHYFNPSGPMFSEAEFRKRCFLDVLWKVVEYGA